MIPELSLRSFWPRRVCFLLGAIAFAFAMREAFNWVVLPEWSLGGLGWAEGPDGVAFAKERFGPILLQTAWIENARVWKDNPSGAMDAWGRIETFRRTQFVIGILSAALIITTYAWFSRVFCTPNSDHDSVSSKSR